MGRSNRVIKTIILILIINVLWFGFQGVRYAMAGDDSRFGNKSGGDRKTEEAIQQSTTAKFYKAKLTEQEKGYYDMLYKCLINREEKVSLEGCTEEQLTNSWDAVINDSPEIFWCNSYQYLMYSDKIPLIEVRPEYRYSSEEIEAKNAIINTKTEEFLASLDKKMSDFDKVKAVYDYVVKNTVYDENANNNQNIDSVFEGRASVCAGYSKTTKYLLEKLGIPSIYVYGQAMNSKGQDSHAWNIVELDGAFFHVDTTWGDPTFAAADEQKGSNLDKYVFYGYLGCTDTELLTNHTPNEKYEYPSCTSSEYNYYSFDHRLFDTYDEDKLVSLIKKDVKEKEDVCSFRFSDAGAYKNALDQINQLLQKSGVTKKSTLYMNDDDLLIITILF